MLLQEEFAYPNISVTTVILRSITEKNNHNFQGNHILLSNYSVIQNLAILNDDEYHLIIGIATDMTTCLGIPPIHPSCPLFSQST